MQTRSAAAEVKAAEVNTAEVSAPEVNAAELGATEVSVPMLTTGKLTSKPASETGVLDRVAASRYAACAPRWLATKAASARTFAKCLRLFSLSAVSFTP